MRIYLVRVRQRVDQSLYLERKLDATTDDDYIAISHVWGTPETITETVVDGHLGVVQLSPGKRDILSILSRPDICASDWFWMDLFCVDQTQSTTISIADQLMSIPHVYKSARCVKVLLEHPICADWHATAVDLLISNNWHLDFFEDFTMMEMMHGMFCGPHMICFDPWFERLWTRQEGLYGQVLDIVPLNLVKCPLQQNRFDANEMWMAGHFAAKKVVVFQFLKDKLVYRGIESTTKKQSVEADMSNVEAYYDFVYRRRIDMAKYGGEIGPVATYEPLHSVWRSGRTTTKPRDYVLAVFPDIAGYIPPPNMRTMTFPELVANALSQPPIQQHFCIVPKVPSGMMMKAAAMTSLMESMAPWILEKPNSVSDAYDGFTLMPLALVSTGSAAMEKLHCVCRQVTVEDMQLSRGEVPRILELCMETMYFENQMSFVNQNHPSMVMSREQLRTERGRVQEYLWENILQADILAQLRQEMGRMGSFDHVDDVPQAVFAEELRRFLVSMICCTSLTTADVILQHAKPCVLSTPFGKILGTLRLEELEAQRQTPQDLQLVISPVLAYHGFLVASRPRTGATTVIGRTVIPSKTFWYTICQTRESFREVSG